MRDDPKQTLKWMQQQLMDAETPQRFGSEDDDLMERVDALIGEIEAEEAPVGNFSRQSKGVRAEQAHLYRQFDPASAVLTKTKQQLRREAKLQKKAEKKAGVNRSIGGLLFLAILECIGILVLLGWWLQ